MKNRSAIRVALVGCGAVSERLHLPPLAARDDCRVTALIDPDPARRAALQEKNPGAVSASRAADVFSHFDAAIVAVPHALHATIAGELLRAGKAVLLEKPMALTSAECDALLEASAAGGALLTVGQMRRFCPAVAWAKAWMARGLLGAIRSVDVREGGVFDWPVASDFQFRRDLAGGGVLMDTGPHTLDMLIHWFAALTPIAYRDDAAGGIEADCEMELELPGGAACFVELSRTRRLRNSAIIEGERGSLEVRFYENVARLITNDVLGGLPFECAPQTSALTNPSVWRHMFDYQLDDWLAALRGERPCQVPGAEGAKVVRLLESLRALRTPLVYVWERFDLQAAA